MNFYQLDLLVSEALRGPFSTNFQYYVPKDFETQIADFYALTALANQLRNINDPGEPDLSAYRALRLFYNIKEAHKASVENLKNFFLKIIPYICAVEMRHFHEQASHFLRYRPDSKLHSVVKDKVKDLFTHIESIFPFKNTFRGKKISTDNPPSTSDHPELADSKEIFDDEMASYQQHQNRDPNVQINWYKIFVNYFGSIESFMQYCLWAFSLPSKGSNSVWDHMYGGSAWLEIAKYYFKIKEVKEEDVHQLTHIIDLFVDLEHNTGSALNKLNHLYKSKSSGSYDFDWLKKFLDVRANMPTPYGYFDVLSSQVQGLVAAFYKAKHGLDYETYGKLMHYHSQMHSANDKGFLNSYNWHNIYQGSKRSGMKGINFHGTQAVDADDEMRDKYERNKHFLKLPYQEILNKS